MENHPSRAFGYEPCGYVLTEEQAKSIVEMGGVLPKNFTWTENGKGKRRRRYCYKAIESF